MKWMLLALVCTFTAQGATNPWDNILYAPPRPPADTSIRAYSEFMPAPSFSKQEILELGPLHQPIAGARFGVSRFDELTVIAPGLQILAEHFLKDLAQLAEGATPGGDKVKGIPAFLIRNNPYWPGALGEKARFPMVSLTPLVLSRTQDDHGKVPWTVYGGGPSAEAVFWLSLDQQENPSAWLCTLLQQVFDPKIAKDCRLREIALGIVAESDLLIPSTLKPLTKPRYQPGLRYVLTFTPYQQWSSELKADFQAGKTRVLPHPLTLIFAGAEKYLALSQMTQTWAPLPEEALQLPLAHELSRFARAKNLKLKVLKSYPLTMQAPTDFALIPERRNHRFQKPSQALVDASLKISPFRTLFDPSPSLIGLYGKPSARNSQVWSLKDPLWLLNGPLQTKTSLVQAGEVIQGYAGKREIYARDYFPPMELNGYQVRWNRPWVSWISSQKEIATDTSLTGFVSANHAVVNQELIPVDIVTPLGIEEELANAGEDGLSVLKLAEYRMLRGEKLSPELASSLLTESLPYPEWAQRWKSSPIRNYLSELIEIKSRDFKPLTFAKTVEENPTIYESRYWQRLVEMTEGPYRDKNNADCAEADVPGSDHRKPECVLTQLPDLAANYLEPYYEKSALKAFPQAIDWVTDFPFAEWGGKKAQHRNLIVVIPGKRHDEAVIMADHYDTAYMEDVHDGRISSRLKGHRHAAKGADDNHSGTAALMEAALALKDLKLERDVWLVHLTGEEFPSDCLGARVLAEAIKYQRPIFKDRPNPKFVGVYVLDMVGHNTDRDKTGKKAPSIFQISPGRGRAAAKLAEIAWEATQNWNGSTAGWNQKFQRQTPGVRVTTLEPPPPALLPQFRAEIRLWWHPKSALYNTDAQIFSDAGIPVVLLMENYDIARKGYHDTEDTLANIDLDYAAGLTRIAIESVAQAANR